MKVKRISFLLFLFFFFSISLVYSYTEIGTKNNCNPSNVLARRYSAGKCYVFTFQYGVDQYWRWRADCANQSACDLLCQGEATSFSVYNITGDTYLATCFNDPACYDNIPQDIDTDDDGASDYCEANYYVSSWQEMWNGNIASACQAEDADEDGISDTVEELLGTDPEVADEMCSANYTNYSVTNYEPVDHEYIVGFYLVSGGFFTFETFTLYACPAFGTPYSYTLGDYGEIPCNVDIKVYELADGIPAGEISILSGPGSTSGPGVDWNVYEFPEPEYTGDSGTGGIGDYVTQGTDNSDTASEIWDEETTPVPDVVLPGSTEADVQIDPKDIAQGVALALNHITELADPEIIETNDEDINWAIISTQGILDDFGDTGFGDGEVITSGDTDNALGVLSWIDDFWTVPEIGQTSFVTIEAFEVMGFEFPEIIINFDYEIVPAIRTLFLFFFYLSCVWIFFRLTRYAWG